MAENGSENRGSGLLYLSVEVWQKGAIYGWWAHNATSFVPIIVANLTRAF
jgi:hypothetical protein